MTDPLAPLSPEDHPTVMDQIRAKIRRSELLDVLARTTAEADLAGSRAVHGPFVCSCGNHIPCRRCND